MTDGKRRWRDKNPSDDCLPDDYPGSQSTSAYSQFDFIRKPGLLPVTIAVMFFGLIYYLYDSVFVRFEDERKILLSKIEAIENERKQTKVECMASDIYYKRKIEELSNDLNKSQRRSKGRLPMDDRRVIPFIDNQE